MDFFLSLNAFSLLLYFLRSTTLFLCLSFAVKQPEKQQCQHNNVEPMENLCEFI